MINSIETPLSVTDKNKLEQLKNELGYLSVDCMIQDFIQKIPGNPEAYEIFKHFLSNSKRKGMK